jgi:hypothetical protein
MLTVHHLGVSQSERIVWLCEELGIPYELNRYDRASLATLASVRNWRVAMRYPQKNGGRGGIRTHGQLAPSLVFKTSSLNHSDTLPYLFRGLQLTVGLWGDFTLATHCH